MSTIEIIAPDHETVIQQFENLKETAEPKLDLVLQKLCALIEGTLKMFIESETHGMGVTAASVETRKTDELNYEVGSWTRGHILRFLDLGTGIYRTGRHILILPKAGNKALKFWVKETGDLVYARYCLVKGILPFDFMNRSTQAHLTDMDEIMKEVM